jgi:hypothetical protein
VRQPTLNPFAPRGGEMLKSREDFDDCEIPILHTYWYYLYIELMSSSPILLKSAVNKKHKKPRRGFLLRRFIIHHHNTC